jgi:hypothetical protein
LQPTLAERHGVNLSRCVLQTDPNQALTTKINAPDLPKIVRNKRATDEMFGRKTDRTFQAAGNISGRREHSSRLVSSPIQKKRTRPSHPQVLHPSAPPHLFPGEISRERTMASKPTRIGELASISSPLYLSHTLSSVCLIRVCLIYSQESTITKFPAQSSCYLRHPLASQFSLLTRNILRKVLRYYLIRSFFGADAPLTSSN